MLKKYFYWLVLAYFLAVVPGHCLGACVEVPFQPFLLIAILIIAFLQLEAFLYRPFLLSLWSLWHLIFMIPFLAIFVPLYNYLRPKYQNSLYVWFILLSIYIIYWLSLPIIWKALVPFEISNKIFGEIQMSF